MQRYRPLPATFLFLFALFGVGVPSLSLALPELPDTKPVEAPAPDAGEDDETVRRRGGKSGLGVMGNDIRKFGEEVVQRIDRLVKKKAFDLWNDPWTMQGIPILFPSPSNGFNLGLRLQLQNIRRQDPHKLEIIGQVLASDRGRYKHQFQIDAPWALGGRFRLTARVAYDRDISIRYFGIGNETKIDPAANTLDNPLYSNVRAAPSLTLTALRYFGRNWRAGPIAGFKWTSLDIPPGSLLLQDNPSGIQGGRTHYFGLAVVHDTLDFEPYPSRGSFNELYLTFHSPFSGSDYNYWRATYTYRRYLLLHRRLIFAHRTLFETLGGDVPFFELGGVGGSNAALAFGGDRYFRGYDANRFIDKTRLVMSFEMRWDPLFFAFARQDITLGFVPFFEFGRVWSRLLPLEIGTWHASTGWGARLIWNSRLVLRTDVAFQSEGIGFAINLGNSF